MSDGYLDLFRALARPFEPGEVKRRPQGGRQLEYVTARTVMIRLDEVLGPANWHDHYVPHENFVICQLTIRLPDGSTVTKEDAGGHAGMTDEGDDEKSAFSDAFKRAAVKVGVGRYLYKDGVAKLPAEKPSQPSENNARFISEWGFEFVKNVNAEWTKEIGEPCPVELPRQLVRAWQLSGHLLKVAIQHKLVEPAINVPRDERWKYLAPAWERHRDAIIAEARAYCRKLWRDAKAKAKAKLQPAGQEFDEVDDGSPIIEDGKALPEGKE
jgi:hypothetical protein